MNIKFIFMSIIVLGFIVNTASFSDLAFADKPDKEKSKTERKDVKIQRESDREATKIQRESDREATKIQREEIKEFEDSTIITTSSTTTICHIPPGNPGNNHTIRIGESAFDAHIGHGDAPMECEFVNWADWESNTNVQELKKTEVNENLVDQLTKQIAGLQKRLQNLFGL